MTKTEIIEIVEDKLYAIPTNISRKQFHPEMIAFEADTHYRNLLTEAYMRDPDVLEGSLHQENNREVYKDEVSGRLYAIIPKLTVEFFPIQGGVYDVEKVSDSSIVFEPYSTRFEKRRWNKLNINFSNNVRFWYDRGVENTDISSSVSVPFSGFEQLVWFDAPDTDSLERGDSVNLNLLISFYGHEDGQNVYVPMIAGGVQELIRRTWVGQARKRGLKIPEEIINQQQDKSE
jgi:hypothetical protein